MNEVYPVVAGAVPENCKIKLLVFNLDGKNSFNAVYIVPDNRSVIHIHVEETPPNALLPILVTELGIIIVFNTEQVSNALLPILVTELGIMIDVRLEQP